MGKNSVLAFATPGGRWDPKENPGYIFAGNDQELLLRFMSVPNFYISAENVSRRTQLANLALVTGKTFDNSGGVIQLRENYRITVGSAQSGQTSKDGMLRSGFNADGIILTYEDPVADAKEIIDSLLEWAEIRQRAKDLIRAEQQQSPTGQASDMADDSEVLNTILYGPPGTGKTYATIDRALQIVEPAYYQENKFDRKKLTEKFKSLLIKDWSKPAGKIAFITFHQSTRYEDFVEGIKPEVIEGGNAEKENVTYDVQDGLFKLIAEKASWRKGNFDEVFENFKKSIDETDGREPITIKAKETTFRVTYRRTGVVYVNPVYSKKDNPWYPVNILNIRKVYETGNYQGVYNPTYVREILKYLKENNGLKQASASPAAEPHVLIIDEISRGNVAEIFGELITLLEPDKRENAKEALEVILPYSKQPFSVPRNLYVIGTMNTADRSVEALDTALRRRFHFEEISPRPELLTPARMLWKFWWDNKGYSWGEKGYVEPEGDFYELLGFPAEKNTKEEKDLYWDPMWENGAPDILQIESLAPLTSSFNGIDLCRLLTRINQRIERLLSKDHLIGHAYLINVWSIDALKSAVFHKILPLLQEYFYRDYARIGLVMGTSFIRVEKPDTVEFMAVDGYEPDDLNDRYVYHLRKAEEFEDNEEFMKAIKAIYA
jgi:5-methylcytosine-specific restriction endonuclease McrBC GTP-binding regulatory subunit McrB